MRRTGRILVNVSGTCCYDWSMIGSKKELLGPSAKIFAIWLACRLLIQEDLIVHENVLGFDTRVLAHFFCNKYNMIEFVSNPLDEGLPTKRPRRLTSFVKMHHTICHDPIEVLKLLQRPPCVDGRKFFTGDQSEVALCLSKSYTNMKNTQ